MSMFNDWKRKRDLQEGMGEGGDPIDGFKFNTDDRDYAEDHDHIQQELFKTVMSKYPEETMQFLDGIAQRGDEEIAALLRKLQREESPDFKEPQHPTSGDEVVPSSADTGHSDVGDE
jgi:hypothetical protein